jgi:hypothetical protein
MCLDDGRLAIDRQPGNFRKWFIACIDFGRFTIPAVILA